MDDNLQTKLELVEKPFHEKTITVDDWIPITPLYEIIRTIFRHIQMYYPENNVFTFDDWHFHDGFITRSKKYLLKK